MENDNSGICGLIEETSITLAIYGTELQPEEISELLAQNPTRAFRAGEKVTGGIAKRGCWMLTAKGEAPNGPQEVMQQLLAQLPNDPGIIKSLSPKYEVQLRIVLRTYGYNRGFDIDSSLLQRISEMGASVGFSIWSEE